MSVSFYPPSFTRLLRKHGVMIWQVAEWSGKSDVYYYYLYPAGLPYYVPINKRIRVTLLSGEVVEIYD